MAERGRERYTAKYIENEKKKDIEKRQGEWGQGVEGVE